MRKPVDVLVTLSTFGEQSDAPIRALEGSGLTFRINQLGRRMRPDEVVAEGVGCRGIIAGVEPYDAATLDRLTGLRCISRCGAGTDAIDRTAAAARGVAVLNTPDEPVIAVAELTVTLMFALLRQLGRVDALLHARRWERVSGNLLHGKAVGLIGLGRIGRRVADMLQPFGVRLIGSDPHADREWAAAHAVSLVELPELLRTADIVSIHAAQSRDMPLRLGARELASMRRGAWLVNVARGDMVDDVALAESLASGHLSGAALDVFPDEPYSGPLCDSDRAILSPHQATLTEETRGAMELKAVQNLVVHLRSGSNS